MTATIKMLEYLKMGNYNNLQDCYKKYKDTFDRSRECLKDFFEKDNYSDEKLLNAMLFLYLHEDMDYYSVERFIKVSEYMHEEYGVYTKEVLSMYFNFRKLILR